MKRGQLAVLSWSLSLCVFLAYDIGQTSILPCNHQSRGFWLLHVRSVAAGPLAMWWFETLSDRKSREWAGLLLWMVSVDLWGGHEVMGGVSSTIASDDGNSNSLWPRFKKSSHLLFSSFTLTVGQSVFKWHSCLRWKLTKGKLFL